MHPPPVSTSDNKVCMSFEGPVKREVPLSITKLQGLLIEQSPVSVSPTKIYWAATLQYAYYETGW